MSLYGNSVKTHIIDPVYNRANQRAEFRLEPNKIYHCNMRIINLGVEATTGGKEYLNGVGAYGVIKNIYLLDGNQPIDQLIDVGKYMTFKNYNNSNSSNTDKRPNLAKCDLGNIFEGKDVGGGMTGAKINSATIRKGVSGVLGGAVNNSQAWLDLKEVFSFLSSVGENSEMKSVNTNMFKSLRVVVEFHKDLDEYMKTNNDTNSATFEPRLIVDEITGAEEIAQNSGVGQVNYVSIEHDRAIVAAVPSVVSNKTARATATQRAKLHISGFNNKTVNKMLIMKNPVSSDKKSYQASATENNRYGKNSSFTYLNEELQVSVDGASIFPVSGINRDSQRLAMLNDSWGVCSAYPFSASLCDCVDDSTLRTTLILGGEKDYSVLDYYGFKLNRTVGDLQLDFKRDGFYLQEASNTEAVDDADTLLTPNNMQIEMNIYAEVNKSIVPSGNGYSIKYV